MFQVGSALEIATQGFLTNISLSICYHGLLKPIVEQFGDITTGGCAPQISVIGGITAFYYPGAGGQLLGGEALVTVKIGGVLTPSVPGIGGLTLGGGALSTTLITGQLIASYEATGTITTGGVASVISKVAGQTSVVFTADGLILISGTAKQEFVKFLKDLFPLQPPLPGPPPVAPLILPSDVVQKDPITQFQKDDISSGLLEVGGGQMHLFPLQLFGNRDWEFVILLRPWSRAVDFALEVWISEKPLDKPIGRKVNITYREITYFYIKEKTLEVWQGETRVFHAIINLQSQGNFFLHIDNLENRKVNKYAMKIETFIYGQTIFDGDTTVFDLLAQTETQFDLITEDAPKRETEE